MDIITALKGAWAQKVGLKYRVDPLSVFSTHITPYKDHKGFSAMYFPIQLSPYGSYRALRQI